MKTKIILSVIFTLFVSAVVVFNSYDVASANSSSLAGNADIQIGSITVQVTFDNGNCDGLFTQIKTPGGTVVLQGYTAFASGINQVSWSSGTPAYGDYVAVVHYNGGTASTDFKWNGGAEVVPVHFGVYASCGDE